MSKLKERVNEVIVAFKQNNEETEKQIKKITNEYKENPSKFKDFKEEAMGQVIFLAVKEQTNPIMENWNNTNQLFNQKIKAIITEEKENILPKTKEKSADYAIRVSNALKYLEIQGDKLNEMIQEEKDANITIFETADDVVFGILKDFIDDYEQMRLFKQVIKRLLKTDVLENNEGKTMFPKTFGNFNKIEIIMNTFNEIEAIANVIFLKGKPKAEMYVINNQRIEVPTKFSYLGYEEETNNENIVNLSEIIDTTVKNMNKFVTE